MEQGARQGSAGAQLGHEGPSGQARGEGQSTALNPNRIIKRPSTDKPRKAKLGGKRLDEFLGGGLPFRSCSVVQGPAFIGKDILLAQFISEGIKYGSPAIVVLTNNTTSNFRKRAVEMDFKLEEREKAGLLTYVDCHSKTVGLMGKNPFAVYLNGVNDLGGILSAIERLQAGLSRKFFYHRILFDSLSSILRAHGLNETIDFINSLSTKTKAYNGIVMFDLAGGIHKPEEINAIEHSMDGSFNLKEDNNKHLLLIKGLPDLRGTQWVEYSFDEKGLDIKGAYTYGYIK